MPFQPNSCNRLYFFSFLLFLCACSDETESAAAEEDTIPAARTNIRMARAEGDDYIEMDSVTRAPDHLGQRIPFVYQMEGPAWENENVAFRMYFDERNGIDIFGKKTKEMVLDRVGSQALGKEQNYHAMAEWGMDVLKVGTSLGAGSIALLVGDSIYRLGDVREEHYRKLTETPEGSSFELTYRGWEVAGRQLDVTWTIAIEPGTFGYASTVTVEGLQGGEELLTGIVNLHSDTLYTAESDDRFVMYTYGPQAELDHVLGMAISADTASVIGYTALGPEDLPVSSTYALRLRVENGEPVSFRFTAGWEPGHPAFAERAAFAAAIY